ncbi:MAG: histidine kinase [Betaproteobacteria bacterium]|jgi:two-component system sensor histidine kinase AlgZ
MTSINQNPATALLPNFRNLGVMLRVLVIVMALTIIGAMWKSSDWSSFMQQWISIAALVQPIAILSVLLLGASNALLHKLEYRFAVALIVLVEIGVTLLVLRFGALILESDVGDAGRDAFFAAVTTLTLVGYFNLRNRALSPALSEARLQALQARIRPHFLFNSINAVLSLIRADPRRAEAALEDMADLFRVLMADNRDLAPLENEVELCRQYLALEQLRLGQRLRIDWHIDKMPADALMPPLVLQPLLENAVYHGIEPSVEPGIISVNIYHVRDQVHMVLRNPYRKDGSHHAGNKMALGNIRERLALHFDAEASLQSRVGDNEYEVHITIPYVKADQ